MAETGTTRLSLKQRVGSFNGRELLPVVRDGATFAGTAQDLAEYVAPLAGQAAPVTQEAIAAANAAAASADSATTSNMQATSAAEAAASSALAAKAASDAAIIQPGLYVDEPTGRAAVADGQAFKVQGDGFSVAAYEYRRVNANSVSTLIATYPAAGAVADLQAAVNRRTARQFPDWVFRDEDGYVLAALEGGGRLSMPEATFASGAGHIFTNLDGDETARIDSQGALVLRNGDRISSIVWPYNGEPPSQIEMDEEGFIVSIRRTNGEYETAGVETYVNGIASPSIALNDRTLRDMPWPASFGPEPVEVVMDGEGFILRMSTADGTIVMPGGVVSGGDGAPADEFTAAEIDARNTANLVYAQNLKSAVTTDFQRPVFDLNIILTYGQSLSNGFRAFPALPFSPIAGLFMLGNSIRPVGVTGGTTFEPVGGASVLKSLASTTQDGAGNILTDLSSLTPDGFALGESLSEAQAVFIKAMTARQMNVSDDKGPQFVVLNCGVDGKSVEDLSKGANPNLYNRIIDAVSRVQAIAAAAGKTCGVVMFNYNQGEWNYNAVDNFGNGATQDKDQYKALLSKLISDVRGDVMAITHQPLPFVALLGQTGANYTNDATGLSIGTAQLELSLEGEYIRLATPEYPFPVKSDSHFEANGARWFGCMFGKVAVRMLRGEDWQPLYVRQALRRGRQVLVDLNVPEPPIKFDLPFVMATRTDLPNKGFSFVDSVGVFTPRTVTIVSDTQILMTLPRDPVGTLRMRVADNANNHGRASVTDSDRMKTMSRYAYFLNEGMGDWENRADYLDKPYPAPNWIVAGQFTVTQA
ncbi:hypothetical protein [Burkholderia cepacia]|uniref:hypothetical protein n=1 Tax=Burkholderia cepacia TaxID=292 RepID=UPI00264DF3C5|nr:hypothetical protein [Burkholderia cepacia]MDN7916133.1 hypothetical protein [Burkholderia cepacia]